jgi:hypothetical protein
MFELFSSTVTNHLYGLWFWYQLSNRHEMQMLAIENDNPLTTIFAATTSYAMVSYQLSL